MPSHASFIIPAAVGEAVDVSSGDVSVERTRGVYVGGAGDLVVDLAEGGTAVTFSGIAAGTVLPIVVTKFYSGSSGTTATGIVALR